MRNPFGRSLVASAEVADDSFGLCRWGLWLQPDDMTEEKVKYAAEAINQHDALGDEIAALKSELEKVKISRDDWKQCAKLQEESLHLAKRHGRTACYLALEWLDDVCDPKSSLATTEGVAARQRIERILLELGGSAEAE